MLDDSRIKIDQKGESAKPKAEHGAKGRKQFSATLPDLSKKIKQPP